MTILSEPLEYPKPTSFYLENYHPFYYQKLEHLDESKRQEYMEEVSMLFDHHMCGGDDPLMFRSCFRCNLMFGSNADRRAHCKTYEHECVVAKHKGLPAPENPLHCKACDKTFKTIYGKEKHLKQITRTCNNWNYTVLRTLRRRFHHQTDT